MGFEPAHRYALDRMEPHWRRQGYTVLRDPRQQDLPAFLGHHFPDAIATGRTPGLIIEVIDGTRPAAATRIEQIKSLLSRHPEWRLEIVYATSEAGPVTPATAEIVDASLMEAAELIERAPRAALLLAWAALEAKARRAQPELQDRMMSTATMVDLLVTTGLVLPDSEPLLRELGTLRNRIAHGDLSLTPTRQQVGNLIALVRSLPDLAPQD